MNRALSFAHRAVWEIDARTGLKALRTPIGRGPMLRRAPSFDAWWSELSETHPLRATRRDVWGPPVEAMPLDWHLDPGGDYDRPRRWPRDIHWTAALRADVGDLRTTWEPNRFGHLARWVEEGRDGAVEFERQLLDWRDANPFRAGVNWASGQEVAVRALNWLVAGAAWGDRIAPDTWAVLVQLLYWHGVQIHSEFGFARHSVRNNHVIAEGLGLAALADAFPRFEESAQWRRVGIEAMIEAIDEQFLSDGGYCQHSHAYHSFALELLFTAADWFEEVRTVALRAFERSLDYFSALVESGGRLPNYGPNDRATVVDYAALLEELSDRCDRPPAPPRSASFPEAGLHVLRAGNFAATLRCGPLARRAGHDDSLNLEVWRHGEPVTVDAGSYRYRSVEHAYYTGAGSHNVMLIGQRGPRSLLAPFTWSHAPDPALVEFDAARGRMTAERDVNPGVVWRRSVHVEDDGVEVVDSVSRASHDRMRVFTLQWVFDAPLSEIELEKVDDCFTWNIRMPIARIVVSAHSTSGPLRLVSATLSAAPVSRTYGTSEIVGRLDVIACQRDIQFCTRFDPR